MSAPVVNGHRALNWLAAALIALVLSTAYLLDGPGELQSIQTMARDAEAATSAARAQARFEAAAQALCGGPNAAWADLGDGAVQCSTKRGHKTLVAKAAL